MQSVPQIECITTYKCTHPAIVKYCFYTKNVINGKNILWLKVIQILIYVHPYNILKSFQEIVTCKDPDTQ